MEKGKIPYIKIHKLFIFPRLYACFSLQARRHLIPRQPLLTVAELLEKIMNDELFGLVQCDVRVPDHLKSYFAQFLPVFKNAMVSLEDVGPHMRALCEHYGVLNKPRRTLISSYYGEQVLLTTSQIQWYIDHGELLLKITPNTGRRCGSGVGILGCLRSPLWQLRAHQVSGFRPTRNPQRLMDRVPTSPF